MCPIRRVPYNGAVHEDMTTEAPVHSTRAVASSTLWQIASQVTMAGLSIITVKFVALGLSKELAGNYNSAYGFLQIFGILADFGLYAVAVREVSAAKDRSKVLGALIVLRAMILVLSLGSALAVSWVIPVWRGTPLPLSITIAALVPFFTLLAGILRTAFQVKYRMHFVFIAEVLQRIVTTSLIGVFILYGFRETSDARVLDAFLLIGGIGSFVLFLVSALYANTLIPVRPRWDGAILKEMMRKALPYGIAFLCVALYRQFDVSLIALLRPDYEIQNAYYGFVQRAMDMAYLFPTFLMNSALPVLAERNSKGESTKSLAGTTLFAILIISTTAFLFAIFWARPLMDLLTSESYLSTATHPGSDTAMRILSGSMLCNGIIVFSFYSLLVKNAWRPLVASLLVGVAIAFTSNLLLIPSLGFVGASITSVIVHGTLALLLLPQSLRAFPAHITRRQFLQWIGFASLLALFLWITLPLLTGAKMTVVFLALGSVWMGIVALGLGIHKSLKLR
jgi:O-antigen/teichoic acid export membrane protein